MRMTIIRNAWRCMIFGSTWRLLTLVKGRYLRGGIWQARDEHSLALRSEGGI
jgi:hypothetical protein